MLAKEALVPAVPPFKDRFPVQVLPCVSDVELGLLETVARCPGPTGELTTEPSARWTGSLNAKTYDAIATVSLATGRLVEFAIECERTLKSPQKYEKVRETIVSGSQVRMRSGFRLTREM